MAEQIDPKIVWNGARVAEGCTVAARRHKHISFGVLSHHTFQGNPASNQSHLLEIERHRRARDQWCQKRPRRLVQEAHPTGIAAHTNNSQLYRLHAAAAVLRPAHLMPLGRMILESLSVMSWVG